MFEINEASDFVLTQIKIVGVGGALSLIHI